MSKVFANLIFQSAVAVLTANAIAQNPTFNEHVARHMIMYAVLTVAAILTMVFTDFSLRTKFIVFTAMSALVAMTMSAVRTMDKEQLRETLLGVFSIFTLMFTLGVVSFQMNIDLLPLGALLFFVLIGTLIYRVITRQTMSKILLPVFALYVLVDTNFILQRNYGGDFVNASFDYFTDIFNLLQLNPMNV